MRKLPVIVAAAMLVSAISVASASEIVLRLPMPGLTKKSTAAGGVVVVTQVTGPSRFNDVEFDGQGGILVVGESRHQSAGNYDALIARYNSDIEPIAAKQFGRRNADRFVRIVPDGSGEFFVAGNHGGVESGTSYAYIVKINSDLEVSAEREWGAEWKSASTGQRNFNSIAPDGNGGLVASLSEVFSNDNGLIAKLSPDLSFVSGRNIGTSSKSETMNGILPDGKGGAIGLFREWNSSRSLYVIMRFDSSMNLVEQIGTYQAALGGIIPASDGGYIIYGSYMRAGKDTDALIMKVDDNLNRVAVKTLGGVGSSLFSSVVALPDGSYVAVGRHNQGGGLNDGLIARYDKDLNIISQLSIGGAGDDVLTGVAAHHSLGVVAVGTEKSTAGSDSGLIVRVPASLAVHGAVLENHPGLALTDPGLVAGEAGLSFSKMSFQARSLNPGFKDVALPMSSPINGYIRSEN